MKASIGVYESHDDALNAILELKKNGFPVKQVSILGQAEIIDNHLHVHSKMPVKMLGVGIGAVLGPILGVLTGVGIVAIPGLGVVFGAGALVGALAGFDVGIIGGTIVSVMAMLGFKDDEALKYEKHLKEGKFLVIAQGKEDEVEHAREILHHEGSHIET